MNEGMLFIHNPQYRCLVHGEIGSAILNITFHAEQNIRLTGNWCTRCIYEKLNELLPQAVEIEEEQSGANS